jgi:hypothetical protein
MESNDSNLNTDDINPLAQVIEMFVKNRQAYNNKKKYPFANSQRNARFSNVNGSNSSEEKSIEKPTIDEFLRCFDQQIKEMNKMYKMNKDQFHKDMKSFNDNDIQQEEEMIERSMNQGPVAITPKVAYNQVDNEQPFINYNSTLKINTFHSADNGPEN